MKQPHEDALGIPRFGDPLVTDQSLKEYMGNLTYRQYKEYLYNANTYRLFERMQHVAPGDSVIVLDVFRRPKRSDEDYFQSVGYLVEHRAEWWQTDEEWDKIAREPSEDPNDSRLVEPDAYYIQYGESPEHVCRWVNCWVLKAEQI